MAPTDVVVPLIQLVALFLPAWAVVMQMFSKFLRKVNLEEKPILIPLFALGFSLSAVSLLLFGWASNQILIHLTQSDAVGNSGPLQGALTGIGLGGLAFSWLGVMILMILSMQYTSYPEGIYVHALAILFGVVMYAGWKVNLPTTTIMVILGLLSLSTLIVTLKSHELPAEDSQP